MLREFIVEHHECPEYGPRLYIITETEVTDDNETYEVEFELSTYDNSKYDVFYLCLGLGGYHMSKFMKSFDDDEAALIYCEQQYTLFNGTPPKLEDGVYQNFHIKGKLAEVEVPDEMKVDFDLDDECESHEYLVIINKDSFEAYSLEESAIWQAPP